MILPFRYANKWDAFEKKICNKILKYTLHKSSISFYVYYMETLLTFFLQTRSKQDKTFFTT